MSLDCKPLAPSNERKAQHTHPTWMRSASCGVTSITGSCSFVATSCTRAARLSSPMGPGSMCNF